MSIQKKVLSLQSQTITNIKTKEIMENFSIAQLERLKESIPFSERLNNFIENWYNENKEYFNFVEVDDFDENDIEGTFEKHKKRFEETKKINIWTGESEGTIFGCARVNHMFRAWHDFIHIRENLGYSITEESIVCDIQRDMLPSDWAFEKSLVESEIRGQAHYFFINNKFVDNQRVFTRKYLENSISAIRG